MTADRLTHLEGVVEGLAEDVAELQRAVARLRPPPDATDAAATPMTPEQAVAYLRHARRSLLGKAGNQKRRRQLARVIATLEALRKGGTP